MFTLLVRILLIIASLGMGVYFYTKSEFINMILILFCTLLFVLGYFKGGTVYMAHKALKRGDYIKAENLISKIKKPNLLGKNQKSYYHFVLGAIATKNSDWDKSYSEWVKALDLGLRTENDTSIVLLNLANVELKRMNFDKAEDFIYRAREFNLKPLIKMEIDRIKNEIDYSRKE